jgi:uncharacterized protein YkwD
MRYYGFTVNWHGTAGWLEITDNNTQHLSPQARNDSLLDMRGGGRTGVAGQYYHTNVRTTLNGIRILAYNIGGRTFIGAEEMRDYGYSVVWDPAALSLTITKSSVSDDLERQVLALVNIERANHGLAALQWHSGLAAVARAHSADMINRGYINHTCPSGITFDRRIINAAIPFWAAAENIAWGQRTAEEVVKDWMDSPGHRANILDKDMTHMGVGFVEFIWTQKFIEVK